VPERSQTDTPPELSAADFQELYDRLRLGVRWGEQDRRGAINNISPAQVADAARGVSRGHTVSLAGRVEPSFG
jgi:hypothetical protein